MALRSQKTACLILLSLGTAAAQDLTFSARHRHLHKGGGGTIVFTEEGVSWQETAKREHSREWKYPEIQRLELAPDHVRIVTYEDIGWQFGRDREYVFDKVPEDLAGRLYPILIAKLDQRFFAHVADPSVTPLYEMPAKLLLGRAGSNGVLKIGADRIAFDGGEYGASRAWRYGDIANVSSAGPFELTLSTLEGENRLALKQALTGDRYNEIWRRITEANGLRTYAAEAAHPHEP